MTLVLGVSRTRVRARARARGHPRGRIHAPARVDTRLARAASFCRLGRPTEPRGGRGRSPATRRPRGPVVKLVEQKNFFCSIERSAVTKAHLSTFTDWNQV